MVPKVGLLVDKMEVTLVDKKAKMLGKLLDHQWGKHSVEQMEMQKEETMVGKLV